MKYELGVVTRASRFATPRLACALVALAAAACSGGAGSSEVDSRDNLAPPQLKEAIGYDALRDEVADFCVSTPGFTPLSGASGQSVVYDLNIIETQEHLQKSLNIDAAMKIKWLSGNVNASFNASFGQRLDMTHVYALASAVVQNPARSLDSASLKKDASDLYAANRESFYRRCGTHFVDSVTTGGLFFALLDIETSSSSEAQTISASISASYRALVASASGRVAVSQSLEQSLSNKRVTVHIIQQGGVGDSASFVGTVDQIVARLTQFASTISQAPVAVDFTLKSYDRLGLPGDDTTAIDVMRQQGTQKQLADKITQTEDALSTYDAALLRPEGFQSFDRAAVARGSVDAKANVDTLYDAARECYIEPKSCALPTGLRSLPPVPQRRQTSSRPVRIPTFRFPPILRLCEVAPDLCKPAP